MEEERRLEIEGEKDGNLNLGTDSMGELFLKIVIPSIIAMVITGMQGIIDGLFLGNYIGESAMASASIASPFLQIVMGIALVISIGGTAFIGRSLGTGDLKKAKDIYRSCCVPLFVCSFLLVFSAGLFSDLFARFL
ncbi:MAG: MATE family efflux transporter [Eubacteriales bacterium]